MGILVALLTVLGAGLIVCLKRKTLLRLLFTSKKNPIEKIRCVFPTMIAKLPINIMCKYISVTDQRFVNENSRCCLRGNVFKIGHTVKPIRVVNFAFDCTVLNYIIFLTDV